VREFAYDAGSEHALAEAVARLVRCEHEGRLRVDLLIFERVAGRGRGRHSGRRGLIPL
jgi:hypothetical protein